MKFAYYFSLRTSRESPSEMRRVNEPMRRILGSVDQFYRVGGLSWSIISSTFSSSLPFFQGGLCGNRSWHYFVGTSGRFMRIGSKKKNSRLSLSTYVAADGTGRWKYYKSNTRPVTLNFFLLPLPPPRIFIARGCTHTKGRARSIIRQRRVCTSKMTFFLRRSREEEKS